MEADKETEDEELRIASLTKTVYDDVLGYITDDDYGAEILGPEGRDFIIEYDPDAQGSDMYSTKLRDQKKSDDLSELKLEPRDLYDMDILKPGFKPTDKDEKRQEDKVPKKAKGPKEDRPKRFGRERDKGQPEYEIGQHLAFDDKKLGTIEGKLTAIETDKKTKKDWYILTDKEGTEFEATIEELYIPEEPKEEKEEKPKRRKRR